MTSKKKSALGLLPLFLLLIFATDKVKVALNLKEQTGDSFTLGLETLDQYENDDSPRKSPIKQELSGQLDRVESDESVGKYHFENVKVGSPEKSPNKQDLSVQLNRKGVSDESVGKRYDNVDLDSPARKEFSGQLDRKVVSDESVESAGSLEGSERALKQFLSATSFKTRNEMNAERFSREHTRNLEELKQKQSKTCACVQNCADSKCVACVRKWAENSKRFSRLVSLIGYTYTMLKELLKVTVDYTLATGEMVVDLTALFIGAGLTIFVETNWKGMLQKLALKVETFYKKDLKYKLKVVFAGALFALLFGSFYLFAWGDVQEYISQLKNPIHLKDRTEILKSFALVTFLHILKVPITAIMPLFAGAFGVLTSIMFPLSAVFVSTFFSGIGLGFWYLMNYLTKFDAIGVIADNTACGPLEYFIAHEWHKEEGGMTKTQFVASRAEHVAKDPNNPKKGLKSFWEEIALPVTYKGGKGEASASAKAAILCLSMIYFRIFFPGIGDSLINAYVIRYGVGFPEVFISLWLGLPENAFMSYALQVIKHPWISALLMIFLGGLATTTWIGKYIYRRRKYKQEEFEKHGYHPKKYDLYKKLLDLLIFLGVFFLTFNIRNILPVDVFELDAYYKNKSAVNCTMSGEYDDMYTNYGEVCNPTTVSRNMIMAWGVGFTGYVTIQALLQTIRNSIPCFKNKNFNKADDFSYKYKFAEYNGKKNILSDKSDIIHGGFNLNKKQCNEKYLELKVNEIDGVILNAGNAETRAAIEQDNEEDPDLKNQFGELKEFFGGIKENGVELRKEMIDALGELKKEVITYDVSAEKKQNKM